MNSCYSGEALLKLLNVTNIVYSLYKNVSKTEKVASKLPTEEARHVSRRSRDHASCMRLGIQGMLARDQVSVLATLVHE